MTTPKIGLPELSVSQASKEITHNEALAILDAVVQPSAVSLALTAPPGSPANGDLYIVASPASGDWTGQEDNLAYYRTGSGWIYITPWAGLSVYVQADSTTYRYDGGSWSASPYKDNELLIWQGI